MATGTCRTCSRPIFKFAGKPGWFERTDTGYQRHTTERCATPPATLWLDGMPVVEPPDITVEDFE